MNAAPQTINGWKTAELALPDGVRAVHPEGAPAWRHEHFGGVEEIYIEGPDHFGQQRGWYTERAHLHDGSVVQSPCALSWLKTGSSFATLLTDGREVCTVAWAQMFPARQAVPA